jgi:hypothetical protein
MLQGVLCRDEQGFVAVFESVNSVPWAAGNFVIVAMNACLKYWFRRNVMS